MLNIIFSCVVFSIVLCDSLYNLNSKLFSYDNNNIYISDLKNNVYLCSMIYTNCKTICPIIVNNMKMIEKKIIKKKINLKYLLISLDHKNDNVNNLNDFFFEKKFNNNWYLFSTNKEEILKISTILGIKYIKSNDDGYIHSNLIILIDKHGYVKYYHSALDNNFDKLIMKIINLF